LNNRDGLQDRGKPAVELDQKQSIQVCEMNPTAHLAPQHHHLMSEHRILGLKPAFRLEWQDQNTEHDAQKHEHGTLTLFDFAS
jgi:hypothetical protein